MRAPAAQAAFHQEVGFLPIAAQENHAGPLVPRRLQQSGLESLAAYLH